MQFSHFINNQVTLLVALLSKESPSNQRQTHWLQDAGKEQRRRRKVKSSPDTVRSRGMRVWENGKFWSPNFKVWVGWAVFLLVSCIKIWNWGRGGGRNARIEMGEGTHYFQDGMKCRNVIVRRYCLGTLQPHFELLQMQTSPFANAKGRRSIQNLSDTRTPSSFPFTKTFLRDCLLKLLVTSWLRSLKS